MIVKSQNPILINTGTGIINTSRSNVKSKSNIRNNYGGYSNFDANGKPTNSAETKIFQDWLDTKYPTWLNGGKLNKGAGYGRYPFGPSTENAWKLYGAEFVNFGRAMGAMTFQAVDTAMGTGFSNPNLSVTDPSGNTKQGSFWDKVKGAWVKAQDAGIFTAIGNYLQQRGGGQPTGNWQGDPGMQGGMPQGQPQPEPDKKGMSGGTIALIIGGIAVVGVLFYLMTKSDAPAQAPASTK